MEEKIFGEIPVEIKREILESLEKSGYHVVYQKHQIILGNVPEFELRNWAVLNFEVDQYRRVKNCDVIVLPEELVGGRAGFYVICAKPRNEAR